MGELVVEESGERSAILAQPTVAMSPDEAAEPVVEEPGERSVILARPTVATSPVSRAARLRGVKPPRARGVFRFSAAREKRSSVRCCRWR